MIYDERYEQKTKELGYNAKELLQNLASFIEHELPDSVAFGLFLVPKGEHSVVDGGGIAYISNGERQGLAESIQFWINESKRRGIIK